MPSGTGVVDAFKNLIRHGKAHQPAQKSSQPDSAAQERLRAQQSAAASKQPQTASAAVAAPTDSRRSRDDAMRKEQIHQQDVAQNVPVPKASPDYRAEAEMIVQEERDSKTKLPVYNGLEKFKLLDKMGDGAFSNVYKALDLASGQKVAIKVVRKYELNSTQAGDKHLAPQFKKKPRVTERANILKEVQIMRGTNHPGIVKLLSFSESEEYYYLVLELCEGGELFHQIVKLTYFSENLARHVILQVAHGIRYLHEERGVVHRDIKPENLLFERIPVVPSKNQQLRPYDEDKEDEGEFIPGVGGGGIGRVKIADFGLSKIVWDEQTMTPCGTVGYTAPEIVKDERYSKSVDMWAMGCVLYTLLCGFPPFYDESINVLTEKVARGYYTFLSPWWDDISDTSKDLITHLLCVDPKQRYTIDEFLAHPWCNAAPAPPPPPTPLAHPMDSPLLNEHFRRLGGNNRETRSPGLATLKEAFDITYAVHRMEEEGQRRQAMGANGRGALGGLNEEDEGEEDEDLVEDARRRRGEAPSATQSGHRKTASNASNGSTRGRDTERSMREGRAGQRDRGGRTTQPFELNIDATTLLGRRNKRAPGGANAPAESSPLARKPAAPASAPAPEPQFVDAPQSPMHY